MSYVCGTGRGGVDLERLNKLTGMMMQLRPQDQQLPAYRQEKMMFSYSQGAEFFQGVQRKLGLWREDRNPS